MMSGPVPAWMEAAVFGWTSLALTNSIVTLAPVSLLKLSSICFLKNGSESGMKLCHCITDRLTPFRLAAAGLAAGAAWGDAGAAAGAAAAGLVASAAGAAGFGASVGLAGAVAPPQAASSMTPAPLAATRRKFRRV